MKRQYFLEKIHYSFEVAPICALLGPRQCGKTTVAKQFAEQYSSQVHHFDLEDPLDLAKFEHPKLLLENLSGLIIIDEIQLRPDLFTYLRVLADRGDKQFLILGSASQALIRQSSETLAGRVCYIEMHPFALFESTQFDLENLWFRGGFPRSYLAISDKHSQDWRKSYIKTFLEKDIRNLGFEISAQTMRRFWTMLTHYHGQLFNASAIGQSIQVSDKTANRYVNILAGTFMIRRLNPWFANISKRQVKSPKIYFRDSGILHTIFGIESRKNLMNNPNLGASWEGFALEEVIRKLNADSEDCYFWRTQRGAELDLLITKNTSLVGFEFKYSDSPKITPSMMVALEDLSLQELHVIIPGNSTFKLHEKITVWGLERFLEVNA